MAQSHETGDSTVDNGHNAVATDPNIAEIQERFRVSEPTAEVISVLDDGGIHAGGGAPAEREVARRRSALLQDRHRHQQRRGGGRQYRVALALRLFCAGRHG